MKPGSLIELYCLIHILPTSLWQRLCGACVFTLDIQICKHGIRLQARQTGRGRLKWKQLPFPCMHFAAAAPGMERSFAEEKG